jgi:hypothetical protein
MPKSLTLPLFSAACNRHRYHQPPPPSTDTAAANFSLQLSTVSKWLTAAAGNRQL